LARDAQRLFPQETGSAGSFSSKLTSAIPKIAAITPSTLNQQPSTSSTTPPTLPFHSTTRRHPVRPDESTTSGSLRCLFFVILSEVEGSLIIPRFFQRPALISGCLMFDAIVDNRQVTQSTRCDRLKNVRL